MSQLREAAQAVLDRWDSPRWEWSKQGPTADLMSNLRAALAEPQELAPMPPFLPVSQWKRGCAACGIGADGKAYGYVCPRSDCPTKVTCGGVA